MATEHDPTVDDGGHTIVIRCNNVPPTILNAIREENIDMFNQLLNNGHPVNVKDNNGWGALHYVAYKNFNQFLDRLLSPEFAEVIDVNMQSFDNSTPLCMATKSKNMTAVLKLLDHGADANLADHMDTYPLMEACQHGIFEMVKALVQSGANVNAQNYVQSASLHIAAKEAHPEIVQYLIDHGATLDIEDENKMTPLFVAARQGCVKCVQILLDEAKSKGMNYLVNKPAEDGATPLYLAAQEDHMDVVKLLLENDADANLMTTSGCISLPLNAAIELGNTECVDILAPLTSKEKLERCNYSVWTHLFVNASLEKRKQLTESLIASGHDVSHTHSMQVEEVSRCPYVFSFCNSQFSLFSDKLSPMAMAAKIEKSYGGTTLELMVKHNARINPEEFYEVSPLLAPIECNRWEVVRHLIQAGVIANIYHPKVQGNISIISCMHQWRTLMYLLGIGVEVESFFNKAKFKTYLGNYRQTLRKKRKRQLSGYQEYEYKACSSVSEVLIPSDNVVPWEYGLLRDEHIWQDYLVEPTPAMPLANFLNFARIVMGKHLVPCGKVLYQLVLHSDNVWLNSSLKAYFDSEEDYEQVKKITTNPRTLLHYSRFAIRKAIGPQRLVDSKHIQECLMLPDVIMDFIYCRDLSIL